jgi:N-acetylmuramoyl-L-alanine amidase CwlA
MTTYKTEKKIIKGLPKNKLNASNFIVAHETANDSSTIDGEVNNMTRNWENAFVTHFVGDGGRVVQVAEVGFVSWGAGSKANGYAYAQVELCRTKSKATFLKDYAVYCQLLADLAKKASIPVTLDKGSKTSDKGIKSHDWVTKNLGGTTHTDPYGYLSKWGISKAQFEKDLVAASKNKASSTVAKKGVKTNVHQTEHGGKVVYFAYDNAKQSFAKVLYKLSTVNSDYDEIPLFPKSVNGYYIVQAKSDIQLYSDSNLTKKYNRKITKGDQAISKYLKHINK